MKRKETLEQVAARLGLQTEAAPRIFADWSVKYGWSNFRELPGVRILPDGEWFPANTPIDLRAVADIEGDVQQDLSSDLLPAGVRYAWPSNQA